jgi:hypothetical protein
MRVVQKLKEPITLKPSKTIKATPCAMQINFLFNCWKSNELSDAKCREGITKLKECMRKKGKATSSKKTEDINNWLQKSFKNKTI